MGRRALKRHVQQELPKTRKRDKNGQFRGGARPGAGRPRKPISEGRASEPHKARERVQPSQPVHVVMRVAPDVSSLRTHDMFVAVRDATFAAAARREDSFHIVHFSIQRTHIHLIVEATDRLALAAGMQAFGISAAKHINAMVRTSDGRRRREVPGRGEEQGGRGRGRSWQRDARARARESRPRVARYARPGFRRLRVARR